MSRTDKQVGLEARFGRFVESLARGADIMRRLMPHFIKGGPGYVPEAVNPLMEEFTHFQEEAGFRALNLRDMPMHGGT